MGEPAWGEGPSVERPRAVTPSEEPLAEEPPAPPHAASTVPAAGEVTAGDEAAPLDVPGVLAVVIGCIGVFVLGIVAAIVAAILAAESGRRARDSGGDTRLAYWGLALAGVDGLLWIAVQLLFDTGLLVG